MADPTQLVVDALHRAVADPGGLPLFGSKSAPGLFAAGAAARQAAQRCKDRGYLRVVRTQTRGKSVHELCAVTEKGLAYLLDHVDARPVLEGLVARKTHVSELVELARRTQEKNPESRIQNPESRTEEEKNPESRIQNPESRTEDLTGVIQGVLARWHESGAIEDCPLPVLYRQALEETPGMTIGQFHDALRRLHEQQRVYLHPWTGPLYDLPEPACALLVGHEVAYYASKR